MIQHFEIAPAAKAAPWLVTYAPVFSAGAVVVVGFAAAYIAFRQWRTAHTKVQLELFEVREPIYQACKKLLAAIAMRSDATEAELAEFHTATANAHWLFSDEIAAYVADLYSTALAIGTIGPPEPQAADLPWQDRWIDFSNRLDWLKAQEGKVDKIFAPYLRIQARRSRSGRKVTIENVPGYGPRRLEARRRP